MIFLKGYILTTSHAQQSFCKKYKYQTQLNPMESNLKNPKNYCKSFNQQGLQYPNKDLLESKKSRFLESLKGKSLAYKRYAKSPLRYGGGKSLAVGLILEHFPNDLCRVISPFIGGGSVEVAAALELGLEVKAFDIFDISFIKSTSKPTIFPCSIYSNGGNSAFVPTINVSAAAVSLRRSRISP